MSDLIEPHPAPCPWCPSQMQTIEGTKRKGYHVTCCSCLAQGPTHHSKEEALSSWNTRLPSPPSQEGTPQ